MNGHMETNQQYQERKSLIEKISEERRNNSINFFKGLERKLLDMNISELKKISKKMVIVCKKIEELNELLKK